MKRHGPQYSTSVNTTLCKSKTKIQIENRKQEKKVKKVKRLTHNKKNATPSTYRDGGLTQLSAGKLNQVPFRICAIYLGRAYLHSP